MKFNTTVQHHQSLLCHCPEQLVLNSESKQIGKAQHAYVFGVDRVHDEGEPSTVMALQMTLLNELADLEHLVRHLQWRIDELEQHQKSLISTMELDAQMSHRISVCSMVRTQLTTSATFQ